MVVSVIVPRFGGKQGETDMIIDLCDTEEQLKSITVGQLEEKIVERLDDGRCQVDLSFEEKDLDGHDTPLSEYGIQHMSVIHIRCISHFQTLMGEIKFDIEGGKRERRESKERLANFLN